MKKNTEKKNEKTFEARAHITGIVADVYEGKHADYISVKTNTNNKFYDLLKVVDHEQAGYEEGDEIDVVCSVSSFFNKEKKASEVSFHIIEGDNVPF